MQATMLKSNDFVNKITTLLSHENEIQSFVKENESNESIEVCSVKVSENTKIIITLIQKK